MMGMGDESTVKKRWSSPVWRRVELSPYKRRASTYGSHQSCLITGFLTTFIIHGVSQLCIDPRLYEDGRGISCAEEECADEEGEEGHAHLKALGTDGQ